MFSYSCVRKYQRQLVSIFGDDKLSPLLSLALRAFTDKIERDTSDYARTWYFPRTDYVKIKLPSVERHEIGALRNELYHLAEHCGINRGNTGPFRQQINSWNQTSWERGSELPLPLWHFGVSNLVYETFRLGYIVDQRAVSRILDKRKCKLIIENDLYTPTSVRKMLIGRIRILGNDDDFKTGWEAVRSSVGYPGNGCDHNLIDYKSLIGDRILPELSNFLGEHDVIGGDILASVVESSVWNISQPNTLRNLDDRETFLRRSMTILDTDLAAVTPSI
jgi:hypothetical protein